MGEMWQDEPFERSASRITLDALDLHLPQNLPDEVGEEKKVQQEGEYPSSERKEERFPGFQLLLNTRESAAKFRRGYANWRQQKAFGAKGEFSDVFRPLASPQPTILTRKESDKLVSTSKDNTPGSPSTSSKSSVENDKREGRKRRKSSVWLSALYNPFTPIVTNEKDALTTPLSGSSLSHILSGGKERNICGPEYPRPVRPTDVTHWIVHFGVGGFHRSHQAVYVDKILGNGETDKNGQPVMWGICGVGLKPFDSTMRDALRSQDGLYSVLSRSATVNELRIVGSIREFLFAPTEASSVYRKLIDPSTHIVSLTVTEKGYYLRPADASLDLHHPDVQKDVTALRSVHFGCMAEVREESTKLATVERWISSLAPPETAMGVISIGLYLRRLAGLSGYTVLSCDNLPGNGLVIKGAIRDLTLAATDDAFWSWIEENASFPCSVVDRITPATAEAHREAVRRDFGIEDKWPVIAEDFTQWILEDSFVRERPSYEKAGVILVKDCLPFEHMKLRLLNGGHSCICYLAYLASHRFVDDAVHDLDFSSFLRRYLDEVTPTVRNVPLDLERYKEKILERFGNVLIRDTLERICEDGSTKFHATLGDALKELVRAGRHITNVALGLAGFIVFVSKANRSARESHRNFTPLKDPKRDVLMPLARVAVKSTNDCQALAACTEFLCCVFGEELGKNDVLCAEVMLAVRSLLQDSSSVRHVLRHGGALQSLLSPYLQSPQQIHDLLSKLLSN